MYARVQSRCAVPTHRMYFVTCCVSYSTTKQERRSDVVRVYAQRVCQRVVAVPFRATAQLARAAVRKTTSAESSASSSSSSSNALKGASGGAGGGAGAGAPAAVHGMEDDDDTLTEQAAYHDTHHRPFGLVALVKVFGFLCRRLRQATEKAGSAGAGVGASHGDLGDSGGIRGAAPAVGSDGEVSVPLQVLLSALEVAGPALAQVPPLLELVQDDLCLALLWLGER